MSEASDEEQGDEQEASTTDDNDEAVEIADASDGRYERLDKVGSGGIGTVYRGRHRELDRDVALKEISEVFDILADLDRAEVVERFREVSQDQASIDHPNVLRVYDIETTGDYPFVVTEYAPNGNLQRFIEATEEGEVGSVRKALQYFIQMLHGLDAAHEAGVVHGRIKPENAVLDPAGNAKLSDFGLSRLVDLSDASQQVYVGVGPVAYNAPEELEDPTAWSKTADLYSLGILFYELLVGKVPGRRSPMPSSFAEEVPGDLDPIFDRMTRDDPEERYPSAKAVLHDLYASDEIRRLLDRQTGVVFFRDPIEHGDELLVASEAAMAETQLRDIEGVDAGGTDVDAEPVEEVAETSEQVDANESSQPADEPAEEPEPADDPAEVADEQTSEPESPSAEAGAEADEWQDEPDVSGEAGELGDEGTAAETPSGTGGEFGGEEDREDFEETAEDTYTDQNARNPVEAAESQGLGDEGTDAETPDQMADEGTDADTESDVGDEGTDAESAPNTGEEDDVGDEAGAPTFEEEESGDVAEDDAEEDEALDEAEDEVLDKLDDYGEMFEE